MEKRAKQKYAVIRKPIDEHRKGHIEMLIDYLRQEKSSAGVKNLIQSFIFLILNDDFHAEILKIRKKYGIPLFGFDSQNQFDVWNTKKDKTSALYEEVGAFLAKHKLTYKKFVPLISNIIIQYICLIKLDYADKKIKSAHIAKLKAYFTNASNNYGKIVGGFDAPDPKFGKNNTDDFDKIWWEFYFYPSDNMVQFKQNLEKYFVWMMGFHCNDCHNQRFFEISNADVIEKYNPRIKKQIIIEISQEDGRVALKFQTYLNTTTKELMRAFEKVQKECVKLRKNLIPRDTRIMSLEKHILHYFYYLENSSIRGTLRTLYDKNAKTGYSANGNRIRTQIIGLRKRISGAFKNRLYL